jgi:hypothetical protein
LKKADDKVYQKFSLKLDRSAETKPEMVAAYLETFKIFSLLDDISLFPIIKDYE